MNPLALKMSNRASSDRIVFRGWEERREGISSGDDIPVSEFTQQITGFTGDEKEGSIGSLFGGAIIPPCSSSIATTCADALVTPH